MFANYWYLSHSSIFRLFWVHTQEFQIFPSSPHHSQKAVCFAAEGSWICVGRTWGCLPSHWISAMLSLLHLVRRNPVPRQPYHPCLGAGRPQRPLLRIWYSLHALFQVKPASDPHLGPPAASVEGSAYPSLQKPATHPGGMWELLTPFHTAPLLREARAHLCSLCLISPWCHADIVTVWRLSTGWRGGHSMWQTVQGVPSAGIGTSPL